MSVRLFIGNLPYTATEADLREHLSSVGEPTSVVLPVDRETGRPRGFAFVDYADRAVAEEAIRQFDQQPFKGRASPSARRVRARTVRRRPRPGGFGGPRPGGPGGSRPPGGPAASRRRAWRFRAPARRRRRRPGRAKNFGPDAPPKHKRKPPRKERDRAAGPIKQRRSAVSTTPTRTGARRTRTRSTSTTSRPRKEAELVTEDKLDDEQE